MRNLKPEAINFLATAEDIIIAHLIRLELSHSTIGLPAYAYLTDASKDVVWLGKTYQAGKVVKIGSVKQTKMLTIHKLQFEVSGAFQDELDRALISGESSYLNKEVQVLRAYIDPTTGGIIPFDKTTNGPMQWFTGQVSDIDLREGLSSGDSVVTWKCANHFQDFEQVNGRMTDDADHRALIAFQGGLVSSDSVKRASYAGDRGFFHSNSSFDVVAKYQSKELRYKLKKKRSGGIRGALGMKNVSLEEYWADTIKEVDLAINLTAKYLPIVYGVQRVGGIPIFADTEKDDPSILWIAYAICEGEIDGFLDLYIDDMPLICYSAEDTTTRTCFGNMREGHTIMVASGGGLGSLILNKPRPSTTSPTRHGEKIELTDDKGKIDMWFYSGTSNQTASAPLVDMAARGQFFIQNQKGIGPEYWDSSMKLIDTAYVVIKVQLSGVNGGRTEVPSIEAVVQGKKLAVYPANIGIPTQSRTSLNPAWQALDYLTSTRYGASVPLEKVDIKSFYNAAQILNAADLSYDVSWVPFWRYLGWESPSNSNRTKVQCNTLLQSEASIFKNLESILSQFQASINMLGGRYVLSMEQDAPSKADITEQDIIGPITIQDTSGKNKWNSVTASIVDPAQGWKANQVTFFNSVYKKQDKGVVKKGNLVFPFITNYYTARAMAERELNKSRFSRTIIFTTGFKYLYLYPNANVTFSYSRYGWDKKPFLISDVELLEDGLITLTLQEYLPSVFINSTQADVSSDQTPSVEYQVLPVRSLRYDTYVGNDQIGANGTLSWLPSATPGVSHYSVNWTGRSQDIQVERGPGGSNDRINFLVKGLIPGEYTFQVKPVLMNGVYGAVATLVVTINASLNLSTVTGFIVLNTEPGYNHRFIGPDVIMEWDPIPEESIVPNVRYELETRSPSGTLISSVIVSNSLTYTYKLATNKSAYLQVQGSIGAYRELSFRIRAVADGNRYSTQWAYSE